MYHVPQIITTGNGEYICAEESLIDTVPHCTTLIGMCLQWDTVLRHTGEWYGAQYQSAVWYKGCYSYSDSYLQLLVATGLKRTVCDGKSNDYSSTSHPAQCRYIHGSCELLF